MENAIPTAVSLGNLQGELVRLAMLELMFTVLAVLAFKFLTRRPAEGDDEMISARGRSPLSLPPRKACLTASLGWLIASGWAYHDTFGGKFFALERRGEGQGIVWALVYEYPRRVREIPAAQVERWTGSSGWSRRSFRHSLLLITKDGRRHFSSDMHPDIFSQKARTLAKMGIVFPVAQ
jgi:hypothetical protein